VVELPVSKMNSVVIESVHKKFRPARFFWFGSARTETHALKGISLSAAAGEVVALLGPNGSGKSTTLKLVSTMLLPDQGRVCVGGTDTRLQSQAVRRQVGFALASERSFFPRLTTRENLDFFAALEDLPRRERRYRVEDVLRDVGLDDGGKQVMKLSSGMNQRLGIARALIKRPSVLLLDEPSRSLDPAAASHLWRLIRQLADDGITIILATHNFSEAVAVADRIAILQKGELLASQRAGGFSVEQLRDFYLEITGEREPFEWPEGVPA
jgi:ABC-2 type transport system ATP-binding protein